MYMSIRFQIHFDFLQFCTICVKTTYGPCHDNPGNRAAYQRLCFCDIDSTIPLLS